MKSFKNTHYRWALNTMGKGIVFSGSSVELIKTIPLSDLHKIRNHILIRFHKVCINRPNRLLVPVNLELAEDALILTYPLLQFEDLFTLKSRLRNKTGLLESALRRMLLLWKESNFLHGDLSMKNIGFIALRTPTHKKIKLVVLDPLPNLNSFSGTPLYAHPLTSFGIRNTLTELHAVKKICRRIKMI